MDVNPGEVHTVKILTWNVNGIRSLFKDARAMKQGLDSLDADIICFQETKITRNCLDEGTALVEGYNSYFGFPRSKSGYSGVATYCKDDFTPFQAEEGLSGLFSSADAEDSVGCYANIRSTFSKKELKELDNEGRAVITLHKVQIPEVEQEKFLAIVNVYCPRADPEKPERLQLKLRYYHLLETRVKALMASGYLVTILGDINTCHKPIDHCDPENMEEFNKNPCRRWLNKIIHDPERGEDAANGNLLHLIDAFRFVNPVEENAFTCWSTRGNARSTNYGTRIDYILLDMNLGCEMDDCIIMKNVLGSDHCPVKAIIDVKIVGSSKCPSFCTKYYPEFVGTQSKLLDFFSQKQPNEGGSNGREKRKEPEGAPAYPKKSKVEAIKQADIANFFRAKTNENQFANCESSESVSSLSSLSEISPDSNESIEHGAGACTMMETDEIGACSLPESAYAIQQDEDIWNPSEACPLSKEEIESIQTALCCERKEKAKEWRSLLSGPKPAPNCTKHNQPCILRTVKKKGQNFNRKFWACARGEGRSDDPNARCNFFQWSK